MAPRLNDKGVALSISVIIVIMLALLATFVTSLGYNQRKLSHSLGGQRAKIYYRAQAGVTEAGWRIRQNHLLNPTLVNVGTGASFTDNAYDPAPYNIDVDGDTVNDCTIDIGPVTNAVTRQRTVVSTGLDV